MATYLGRDPETNQYVYDTGTSIIRTDEPLTSEAASMPMPAPEPVVGQAFSPEEEFLREQREREYRELPTRRVTRPIDLEDPGFARPALQDFYQQSLPVGTTLKEGEGVVFPEAEISTTQEEEELGVSTRPPAPDQPMTPTSTSMSVRGFAPVGVSTEVKKFNARLAAQKAQNQKDFDAIQAKLDSKLADLEKASEVDAAQRKVTQAEGVLNDSIQQLQEFKIDPQRAFPNMFSKVSAVLGVALGAYAQGLSGGKLPNTALQIVNGAIERDIAAQKAEFQKLRGLVDTRRNIYGMAMDKLGNERQATEVARAAAYQAAGLSLDLKSKQLGVDDRQNAQIMEGIKTQLQQRQFNASMSLKAQAAQGAAKPVKLQRDFGKAMAQFEGSRQNLKQLMGASDDTNAFLGLIERTPVIGTAIRNVAFTDQKKFDDLSERALLDLLRAMSGLTVTEQERQAYRTQFPDSGETRGVREGKIYALMRNAVTKGRAAFATASADEKREIASRSPDLFRMLAEDNPAARDRLVYSFMTGKSQAVPESFSQYAATVDDVIKRVNEGR